MTLPLPDLWRLVRLGDITRSIRYGVNEPSSVTGSGPKLLRISDVDEYGQISTDSPNRLQRKSSDLEKYSLRTGDVLLARSGSVGKAFVVPAHFDDWVFASYFIRFRMIPSLIEPSYIHFFCLSRFFQQQVGRVARVVAQPNVNSGEFASMSIILPPLAEQRRIVQTLQEFDYIRQLRAEAETKVLLLNREIFYEMFLSTERERWPTITVEESAAEMPGAIRTGPFGSDLLHSEFVDEGIPVLGIDNVVTNRFSWRARRFIPVNTFQRLKKFRVYPNDVLVTIMGTVGRSCVAPPDLPECISTKHLCVITLNQDKLLPSYLSAALLYDPQVARQMLSQGRGAIMEGWSSKIVKALRIAQPPMHLQKEFARKLEATEGLYQNLEESRGNIELLRGLLSAEAFSGRLTRQWRDARHDELTLQVQQRDAALKQIETSVRRTKPIRRTKGPKRSIGAVAELSVDQLNLLFGIRAQASGIPYPRYFSSESLSNSLGGKMQYNRQAIEGHLAVLAARGLIIPISREEQSQDTGEFVFGDAYRLPLDDYGAAEGEEQIIGDHARLRELERLASQLELERLS